MVSSVAHISFSESGGAGSVAQTLSGAQRARGRDSSVHTVISRTLRAQPFVAPLHTVAAGVDEYIIKNPLFSSPISLMRDRLEASSALGVSNPDIIHLHGINGVTSLASISARWPAAKIVWTLHDMNPFTGTCHYSLGCQKFEQGCRGCPAVRRPFRAEVSRNLNRKLTALPTSLSLSLVAPSTWLADQASGSSVFEGRPVTVIPNPVDPVFGTAAIAAPPRTPATFRAVIVAQNLDDPVKGVASAVTAWQQAFSSHNTAELKIVGENGQRFVSAGIEALGVLRRSELGELFASCDALIVSSQAENAPLVIAEASSAGVLPLVRDVGGMPEMVALLRHGATFDTTDALAALLVAESAKPASTRSAQRNAITSAARQVWGIDNVVANYDKVYGS